MLLTASMLVALADHMLYIHALYPYSSLAGHPSRGHAVHGKKDEVVFKACGVGWQKRISSHGVAKPAKAMSMR
jgi:hypothetical protein